MSAGGHAAFQAILHILSELRNPLFDVPDRPRALRALHMSRLLKENNHTKAWAVVKGMIDKAVGESAVSQSNHSESLDSYASPPAASSNHVATFNYPVFVDQIPSYALQQNPGPESYIQQPVPEVQPIQPDHNVFNWDDLHLNSTVGDIEQNPDLPEFDWVSLPLKSNLTSCLQLPGILGRSSELWCQ